MIHLKHIEGSKQGQVESFDSERIRIGRHLDNDLQFDPEIAREVSGHHAEILCHKDAVTIKDLQSRNGTYVNGRRINQPTQLTDGDVIQFSSRGPKLVFSIGEAVAGSGTVALRHEETAAPEATAKKSAGIGVRERIALGVAAAVILAALGLAFWWSWSVFFIALAVTVVAVSGCLAVRWWKKRRGVSPAEPRGAEEAHLVADTPSDQDALKTLRHNWSEALVRLRQSKLGKSGEDPVDALPWVLVMGERGSGKTEAIRAANPPASLSSTAGRQAISGTRSCDWWFFDNLVVLDTPGRYVFPIDERADGKEWHEILSLLKRSRAREPINGVIVTVAADALASRSVESLQDGATQLRRRLDEMVRHLEMTFPVYLVVTKTDSTAWFTEFFSSLPEAARGQAMGLLNGDLDGRIPATTFLGRAFGSICSRLERLRLAVMEDEDRPDPLRRLFLFPQELGSLSKSFVVFADALFRPTRYVETPPCRGVFFTSARQQGVPASRLAQEMELHVSMSQPAPVVGPFFCRDLFSVILPQDRPLVQRTTLWHERYRRGQKAAMVAAGAISLVLCGLLTLSFIGNSQALSRLDLGVCVNPSWQAAQRPLEQRLKGLDGCRETIAGLTPHSFWERLTTNFGLRQTSRIEGPLSRHYLQAFQREVMDPLDVRIDQRLVPGPTAPVFASLILQRIELIAGCKDRGGCPDFDDRVWPNYRIMLAAEEPHVQEGDPLIAQLRRTHGAYLQWQTDTQGLDEMRAKDIQRVSRWLNSGGLRPEWILASVRSQFPPVRWHDFWGVDGPSQVDPPFTQRAWSEGIKPLLSGLRAIAPEVMEVQEALTRFEVSYRIEGFRQWEQFLANFPRGERALDRRDGSRDLASRTLGPASPYWRIIDMTASELSAVLGVDKSAGEMPSWAASLQRYVAVRAMAAEAQKSAKEKPDEPKAEYREEDRQAVGYLTGYLAALDQLQGELGSPEKSFRFAKRVFEEGEATERSTVALQKAVWNLKGLRAAIGARDRDDEIFWTLLARPVELAWRVVLDEAGLHLQSQWEAFWLELAELTPGQRLAKVMDFVNGPATTFLERSRDRFLTKRFLNGGVSFTPTFLAFTSRIRSISPEYAGRLDAPRQIVASP